MDKWRNKPTLFLVSKLFFHTNPRFDTDLHEKGANLPILGRQRGNAACLRPLSHVVFLHIVLCSCEVGGSHKPFWELSVLVWKMGDDNAVQVDVRRSFQRDSAHLAFSRDETFWQRERNTHKKSTRSQHPLPLSPQPSFPQIKYIFQGRNNSGSSPMTLCAQLSQRITWFVYSLECCKRMIELLFFIFFHSQLLMCTERPLDRAEVWRARWSVAASIQVPSLLRKVLHRHFSQRRRVLIFYFFNVREQQARTSSPFGRDIVICSQRNSI